VLFYIFSAEYESQYSLQATPFVYADLSSDTEYLDRSYNTVFVNFTLILETTHLIRTLGTEYRECAYSELIFSGFYATGILSPEWKIFEE
jgi:hypothetical protein